MASLSRLKLTMLLTMALIFGTLFALISVAVFLFETFAGVSASGSLTLSLVVSLIFILVQWYVSPWVVAFACKLQYLKPGENVWLEDNVAQLAAQASVPMPKLAVVPDDSPNAFVFGRTKSESTLAVHAGLLKRLTKDEVRAVIAHEIGHLRHNDCVVMTIVSAVPLVAYMIARSFMSVRYFGGNNDRKNDTGGLIIAMILTAVVAWIVYFISQLLVMWLSRSREYYADAYSAYSTKNPDALASALSKIAYGLSIAKPSDPSGLRAFYIEDPSNARKEVAQIIEKKDEYDLDRDGVLDQNELEKAMRKEAESGWGKVAEIASTHPATYKRIILLQNIGREMGSGFSEAEAYKLV